MPALAERSLSVTISGAEVCSELTKHKAGGPRMHRRGRRRVRSGSSDRWPARSIRDGSERRHRAAPGSPMGRLESRRATIGRDEKRTDPDLESGQRSTPDRIRSGPVDSRAQSASAASRSTKLVGRRRARQSLFDLARWKPPLVTTYSQTVIPSRCETSGLIFRSQISSVRTALPGISPGTPRSWYARCALARSLRNPPARIPTRDFSTAAMACLFPSTVQ